MNKKIPIQFLLVVSICLFAISPAWGWSKKITGIVHEEKFSIYPSMNNNTNRVMTMISCYDAWKGTQLSCPYTQEVIGLKEPYVGSDDTAIANNGGHVHNYDTRPYFYPADAGLLDAFDEDIGKKRVKSNTYSRIGMINHAMPEVSGRIVTETLIHSPKGWECASGCFTDTSTKYETTINVVVYEIKTVNYFIDWSWYTSTFALPLAELPDPSTDDHYLRKGQTDTHPVNHYGTTNTITQLKDIAKQYFKDTGRTLQINDISLPKGGLFDINANWKTSHITHRTGTDADINVDSKWCVNDTELRNLVDGLAEERENRPHLLCENEDHEPVGDSDKSGKYKHIDFD
jgi:hypothetical protein